MEKVYFIEGLDCANCAAKLERHLKEISEFDSVIIDFMAQKLLISVKDEGSLQRGLLAAKKVIDKVEPGVTITEKAKKKKKISHSPAEHHHEGSCDCGQDHSHTEHHHEGSCDCGHDHSHTEHHHEGSCDCDHDHSPAEHHHEGSCDCGHDHSHTEHHHEGNCDCGHDHGHAEHHHEGSCDCGHNHSHAEHTHSPEEHDVAATAESTKAAAVPKAERFTAEMRQSILKIVISAVLFAVASLLPLAPMVQIGAFLLAYLIVGGEVVLMAIRNIARGQIFDENFLMSIATLGAFCIGEYPEGVMVMLLYQLGELFQDYAVNRSRRSIADLMDIKPEVAHVQQGSKFIDIAPDEVAIGDIIQVRPGEKVPLDGVVLTGASALDTVALTGESVPQEVAAGQQVLSGCINISGLLTVRVEKEYEDSTVAKILDLVENASSKKADTENFITRFARYYTPAVVGIAALLAIVPPLVTGDAFGGWIYRALVFLVISCPCALVISIPLTFFGGLGACSRHGILVKGSNYLEALAQLESAVFDKTGTLTKGWFAVTEVHAINLTQEQLLYYAACAESISNHPIARALQLANKQPVEAQDLQKAEEIAGHGISAAVNGHSVLTGNYRLMEREHITCQRAEETGTIIYVAVDGKFCGWIVIADEIKPDAKEMVTRLKELGVRQLVMLTGDNQQTAEKIAGQLGITKVFSQLLPGDKVTCLEQILQQKSKHGTVAFTGDGLNDAPVLARADVGIAMGGLGSDAAIEAADVVIMNDQPSKLAEAVTLARQTRKIVKQNIIFILTVKLLVLILGAVGIATMWMAVFADVGVAVMAILNAIRIIRY